MATSTGNCHASHLLAGFEKTWQCIWSEDNRMVAVTLLRIHQPALTYRLVTTGVMLTLSSKTW